MLCTRCGKPLDQPKRYCDECAPVVEQQKRQEQKILSATQTLKREELRRQQLGSAGKTVAIWGLAFLVQAVVFLYTVPDSTLENSLLLAIISTFAFIAVFYWLMLWLELVHEEPIIGFLSLFIWAGPYYVLTTHPEKVKWIFAKHCLAGAAALSALWVYVQIYDSFPLTDLADIVLGRGRELPTSELPEFP